MGFFRAEKAIHPKRILAVRIDCMGDVVVSTPVVQALRKAYPDAYIAMMVRPAWRGLLEGNPYLDDILVYDKDRTHRGILSTIRFAWQLRSYRFDTAFVLNPRTRSHWFTYLAGIPVRIGFNSKNGWLLSHRIPLRKQEGLKHEAEYVMELLQFLNLKNLECQPFVPVSAESKNHIDELLKNFQVGTSERILAIHPSSSCLSRRWMLERFAELADRFIEGHGVKVVLIAGPSEEVFADQVEKNMRNQPINLAGKLSLADMIALLKRCCVLVSNNSGPAHVAAALGTLVVSIFGANQPGLGATRWRPLGPNHIVLQKDVGCKVCLAHDCDIQFRCLTELSVDEVYQATVPLLNLSK